MVLDGWGFRFDRVIIVRFFSFYFFKGKSLLFIVGYIMKLL